jgi:hypothetical protein
MLDDSVVICDTVSMDRTSDGLSVIMQFLYNAGRGLGAYLRQNPDVKTFTIYCAATWSAMHVAIILKIIFALASISIAYTFYIGFYRGFFPRIVHPAPVDGGSDGN